MSAVSNYAETAILNALFRNTTYTSPATTYLALYTSDPTDADVGSEVSGGSYARQAITFGAPAQVGGKAQIQNTNLISFPVATAAWGTITHIGIRDAGTGGNLLWHGPITTVGGKVIDSGDQATYAIGGLTLTLD